MNFPTVFQLSDIRGFVWKTKSYDILLRNGMRVDATPEEVSKIKESLKVATAGTVKRDKAEILCK